MKRKQMLYYSDLTVNSSSSSLVVFGCLNKSVNANNKSTKANKRSGWEEKKWKKSERKIFFFSKHLKDRNEKQK